LIVDAIALLISLLLALLFTLLLFQAVSPDLLSPEK
jgi:hypothetical protein